MTTKFLCGTVKLYCRFFTIGECNKSQVINAQRNAVWLPLLWIKHKNPVVVIEIKIILIISYLENISIFLLGNNIIFYLILVKYLIV